MGENKRYYWLKLKEDFFADIRMKRLRKYRQEEHTQSST